MTQKTLNTYREEFQELREKQRINVAQYNRKKNKETKRKVMNEKIIPLEIKINNL